ncbi:MAG: rod shape-determining protein MreD [Actinomycetota bacterium]|nr:rod shape-determining protein MreD [Actinomycetota bacterium]
MSRLRYLKLPLILLAISALERSQLGTLTIQGIHPDILLAASISFGLLEGREVGAVVGFVLGIVADSFAQTPFGVSSLVYLAVGYGAGLIEVTSMPESRFADLVVALIGGAVGVAFLDGVLRILGIVTVLSNNLVVVVTVTSLTSGIFTLVIAPILRFLMNVGEGERPPSRRGAGI